MTGLRDTEGMFVFAVGRVVNAWLVEEAIFAYTRLIPYLEGTIYSWWTGSELFSLVDNL